MKVAVLWTRLSGYLNACLRALADQGDAVLVSSIEADERAPFDSAAYSWLDKNLHLRWMADSIDQRAISEAMYAFRPEVILVGGWNIREYVQIAKAFRGKAVRILAMDNVWRSTVRQTLGALSASLFIRSCFDAAFIPGERQYQFARRLGFKENRILRGLYVADQPSFARAADNCQKRERSFVFVGRLVAEKGFAVLVNGYSDYRRTVANPWPLIIFGAGPLRWLAEETEGIKSLGFIQPANLPEALAKQGCLVLPSIYEPWGLVIHEAACAGLPIICTSSCGASVHLVVDGYNGLIVEPGKPRVLSEAFVRVSAMSDVELSTAGRASRALSDQFTPARWATYLRRRVGEIVRAAT